MTITEALQEIKTLGKRIEKKRDFIINYLWRQNNIRDPHESSGGSQQIIKQEMQAINDLENNIVELRTKIAAANSSNVITLNGDSKSIADWIIWRREIAQNRKEFVNKLAYKINHMRADARSKGLEVIDAPKGPDKNDVIVNINEMELAKEIEKIETTISMLDGQLSLKNATINI